MDLEAASSETQVALPIEQPIVYDPSDVINQEENEDENISMEVCDEPNVTEWPDDDMSLIPEDMDSAEPDFWFKYHSDHEEEFLQRILDFQPLFKALLQRRNAALTILKFWRAAHAKRSWLRFKQAILQIQSLVRQRSAKKVLEQLRSERNLAWQKSLEQALIMRQDPAAWVAKTDPADFQMRIESIQSQVNREMEIRLREAKKMLELNIGSKDKLLALIADIENRQKALSNLRAKREEILGRLANKPPRVLTPKKMLTSEEVEAYKKKTAIEPLIDLTDLVKRKKLVWNDQKGGELVTGVALFKENLPPAMRPDGSMPVTPTSGKKPKSCLKANDIFVHPLVLE